jgi:hypothetical protein
LTQITTANRKSWSIGMDRSGVTLTRRVASPSGFGRHALFIPAEIRTRSNRRSRRHLKNCCPADAARIGPGLAESAYGRVCSRRLSSARLRRRLARVRTFADVIY